MKLSSTNEHLKFGFIIFTVLVSINFWSFSLITDEMTKLLEAFVLMCLLLIVLYYNFILRRRQIFKNNVFFFMLIPLLSAYGALIFHDQSLKLSLIISRVNLFWLFYFVLLIFDIPSERIIKMMILVGLAWASLTIIQQVTYPIYYFYSREDSDSYSIYRGGVYRYMIYGQQYGAFFIFYFFYQYLTKKNSNYLFYVLFGLVGFYCYGTRQFALAALACLFIAIFLVKGKAQLSAVMIILIAAPVLLLLKDALFAQYIEMTNEQLKYGDDVRQLAAVFFLNEYWPEHWAAKITGNGTPHIYSKYGHEMEIIRLYNHFYRSDVGIIGAYNEFGILYVLNILWVNLKGLKNKFFTNDSKFLKLLFFYSLILLVTSQYYNKSIGIPFYCLVFYLIEKSFEEKKQVSEVTEEKAEELQMAI
jgi:hypothetical protein